MLVQFIALTIISFLVTMNCTALPATPNVQPDLKTPSGKDDSKILSSGMSKETANIDKIGSLKHLVDLKNSMISNKVGNKSLRTFYDKEKFIEAAKSQTHLFLFESRWREEAYVLTEATKYAYSVVLIITDQYGQTNICSGSLVAPDWVVTAAHCLADGPARVVSVYAGLSIRVFGVDSPKLPPGSEVRECRTFYPHPNYRPEVHTSDYDIGLVKVDPPFKLSEYIKTVQVTGKEWPADGAPRECVLTAFGRVQMGEDDDDDFVKKTQMMRAQKPCSCKQELIALMDQEAFDRYVCMTPEPDFGTCMGDSGAGLVCGGKLAAVTSWTANIKNLWGKCRSRRSCRVKRAPLKCGDPKSALDVFQDVYPSLSWIGEHVPLSEYGLMRDSKAGSNILTCSHHLLHFVIIVHFLTRIFF